MRHAESFVAVAVLKERDLRGRFVFPELYSVDAFRNVMDRCGVIHCMEYTRADRKMAAP